MSDTPTKPEEAQAETIPTWGYSATEPAQIFHLPKGESLPEGWHDSPASIPVVEATGGGMWRRQVERGRHGGRWRHDRPVRLGRRVGLMATLSSLGRKQLPRSAFGLPGKRKYPMPDKQHAADAKGRATQQVKKGNLSRSAEKRIDAKANRILRRGAY